MLIVLVITVQFKIYSQDIYHEDFELPEGTIVDNGTTAWSRDISNANLGTSGFFETRIEMGQTIFKAVDLDGEAVWISQSIDISAVAQVRVSIDIAENGTLEGNDYIRMSIKIDGGTEIIYADYKNDFGDSFLTVTSPPISGSNLQIIIRVYNNEIDEAHLIDDVRVFDNATSGTTLYSRGNRNWNNQTAWSATSLGGPSCHCTPDGNTNVVIGNNDQIALNNDGLVKNLTIQDNGSLSSSQGYSIIISGNTTINSINSEPLDSENLEMRLIGVGDQVLDLDDEDLYDLIIDKTAGRVLLTSPLNLIGSMSFLSASEVVSDGYLTLISTSDGTTGNASIGTIPAGGLVSGNVTVQRFISGEGEIWRYISTPVSNATIADWQDDFPITGTFSDPSTGPGINSNRASLYYYGESGSGSNKQLGWNAYPTSGSAASNPIIPGTGYSALMLEGTSPTLIEVTGTINQGDFTYNVSFAGSGWNLLGNPYPATVNWGNTNGWNRVDVANAIYIRNNENGNENSIIASFVDGVGTNGGTGLVATGQSFWVQAIGSNPSLAINERAKNASSGVFFRERGPVNLLRVTLKSEIQSDEAVVRFSPVATFDYDPEMDAKKFFNGGINVSTQVRSQGNMAINSLPELVCEEQLKLNLSNTNPGNYQLRFTELSRLDLPYTIYLVDSYLDSTMELTDSAFYEFSITASQETFQDRFELSVHPELLQVKTVIHGQSCQPGEVNLAATANYPSLPGLQYHWYNDDYGLFPLESNSTGEFTTPSLSASKSYFVSVSNATGCESERIKVIATIENFEDPEILTTNDNTLKSNYFTGNQWYFNNEPIAGADQNIISIAKPGTYGLEVKVSQCQLYKEIEIQPYDLFGLVAYPNPADNLLNLSLPAMDSQDAHLMVYNNLGKLVVNKSIAVSQRKVQLDLKPIEPGLYYLELITGAGNYKSSFIKSP